VLDWRNFRRAPRSVSAEMTANETWSFRGGWNVVFLLLVLASVFISRPAGLREVVMIAAALGSYFTTRADIHEANDFTFHPVKEVAWIFLGIFATMVPAIDYLQLHARELALDSPLKFYLLTGSLSAFLDNAPTYLTFFAVAMGNHGWSLDDTAQVRAFLAADPRTLMALSTGAVFFGALTYIGNGPNFMVKSIAVHARAKAPNFLQYIVNYALPYLLPLLLLVAWWFF
jgi:Na+/H+ antiporter NhaD/arsenite permease-like protein